MKTIDVLQLFKCLSDASRLQILTSLSKEDMYVERLAERLNLSSATISNHLKKLEEIGAVVSQREQYYNIYSLCPEVFSHRIIDLVKSNDESSLEDERDAAYRQKILSTFMVNGKIARMPAQLKKKLILIEEIGQAFEMERAYTEKEMNLTIANYYDDFCMVRRYFVDYGLFSREDGVYYKKYDRIGSIQMPAAH